MSGTSRRDQGISKAGNPLVRTAMIELAWLWLRHQSKSALSHWFHDRVGATKGRLRRVAIVALARKLLVGSLAICQYGACSKRRHAQDDIVAERLSIRSPQAR